MNDNLELYKEFYFREIERKNHLNNGVNIPILVITMIVSIHFYLFSQPLDINTLRIGILLSSINLLVILFSVYYLSKSFSNFFSSHEYREIPDMFAMREYEKALIEEQNTISDAQFIFESHLIKEFTVSAKHNFDVNKSRTEDLAKSKILIIFSVLLSIIFSIVYIISIALNFKI